MAKDNFLIHNEWIPLFQNMEAADAGLLIQAICQYQLDGDIPQKGSPIFAPFMMIKAAMDVDKQKYRETCEKRKNSIDERWKKKTIQEDTNEYKSIQMNENDTDASYSYTHKYPYTPSCLSSTTGKEDRGMGEEEKPKRETQETIFDRLIESQNVGLEMENILREWLKYKTERRETYKETGMKNMITQVQNAVHRFGEVAVMDRIRQAMANTWKGMNLDKMVEQKAPERRMDNVNSMIDRWAVASEEYERRKYDTG